MGLIDFIFPKKCLGCGGGGSYICDGCLAKVARARVGCPKCGGYSFGGKVHRSCRRAWGLDGVVSIWKYEGVIRKAVLKLKYNYVREIAEELGERAVFELKKTGKNERVILVAVPLFKRREKWRGFNQAAEMGKIIAGEMGWDFSEDLIVRKKGGVAQAGLGREERMKNVRGVFVLNSVNCSALSTALRAGPVDTGPITKDASSVDQNRKLKSVTKNTSFAASDFIKNKIVIFDDVWTTGATIKECGKVLKRAGAKEVWGMTIAA
jgi:predicted amidophosphoribosyltransferase